MTKDLPRLALLGPAGIEVSALFEAVTQVYPSEDVTISPFAGGHIIRALIQWESARTGRFQFELVATTCDLDFEGAYSTYFESAAGIIALIPTDPNRLVESRRVLSLAEAAVQDSALSDVRLPLVLQYQWKPEHLGVVTPEAVDESLGLLSKRVRILSRFDHEDQVEGITTLLTMIQARSN